MAAAHATGAVKIYVIVRQGILTLAETISERSKIDAAIDIVARIAGVRAVRVNLKAFADQIRKEKSSSSS